jgi:ABC-type nitrate/sulfonate/bicarbonate transport system substrate-binding protein
MASISTSTNGGGETLQAVISGSIDLGIAAGTSSVLGAFAKGAPVRILLAGATGASDLYWYVPTASPLINRSRNIPTLLS